MFYITRWIIQLTETEKEESDERKTINWNDLARLRRLNATSINVLQQTEHTIPTLEMHTW